MASLRLLSLEGGCESSFEPLLMWRASELNFGVVALVLLATLTIAVALMFPDAQVATTDFLIGP
jgi:hypothetical protein